MRIVRCELCKRPGILTTPDDEEIFVLPENLLKKPPINQHPEHATRQRKSLKGGEFLKTLEKLI